MDRQLIIDSGLTVAGKMKKSFLGGIGFGALGRVQDVAMIGFQAANAGRGGFVPSIIGQSAAIGLGIPLTGFISAGLCLIPGVGPLAGAIVGNILSGYAELRFGSELIKKIRLFTDMHRRIRHLEMGGSYQDSLIAQRQRFRAIQDMNAALVPSRRYLGQEALIMHR